MKVGSIIEYIGGQSAADKTIFHLKRNYPYIIEEFFTGIYPGGPKPSLAIEEAPGVGFILSIFKEVQSPDEVNIEELLEETKHVPVTLNDIL